MNQFVKGIWKTEHDYQGEVKRFVMWFHRKNEPGDVRVCLELDELEDYLQRAEKNKTGLCCQLQGAIRFEQWK